MTWVVHLHLAGLAGQRTTVCRCVDGAPAPLRRPSAEMDPVARRVARDALPAQTPAAPIRRLWTATHLDRALPRVVPPGPPPHPLDSAPGRRQRAASGHPGDAR